MEAGREVLDEEGGWRREEAGGKLKYCKDQDISLNAQWQLGVGGWVGVLSGKRERRRGRERICAYVA